MSTSIADLAVNISTNIASLETGMAKAADVIGRAAADMSKKFDGLNSKIDGISGAFKTLATTLGVGLTIAGIEQFISSTINAQAELGRLAERSASTVEALSSMRVAAHDGGVSLDDVSVAMARLSKAVFEGQDKATKAAAALGLLQLKASDLAKMPTAQALQTVAVALDRYNESAGKLGVEQEILSKSGPKFGAFLKSIAENGTVAASVTTEMANAARAAEAKIFTLTDTLDTLRTAGVNTLLPALNAVVGAFADWAKEPATTTSFWSAFGEAMRIAALGVAGLYIAARDSITALHALGQALNLSVTSGHFAADVKAVFDASDKSIEANHASLLKFYDAIAKGSPALATLAGRDLPIATWMNNRSAQYKGDPYYGQGSGKLDIGKLPPSGKDDPARKLMEAALATLKAYTEQEKAVLANSNQFLQAEYDRGDVSLSDFFTAKQAAQDEDLARTTDSYVKQITLIDNFIKHAATLKDKAQGEKEKVAATAAQTLAVIQAAGKSQQLIDEQDKLARDYGHTLDEVNAKMLDLQGNTAAAAAIRFDAQNETLRNRLTHDITSNTTSQPEKDTAKARLEQLDAIKKNTVAQAALNSVQQAYTLILDKVSLAQSRIDLAQQTGQITELQAISQKADAAQAKIAGLNTELAKYAAEVAKEPDGPVKAADLLKVDQMKLQIEQLAASSDVLAGKFRDIFESGATTFFTDLISGTKTVKQAFLDMGKSIEQSISQIAAKNIAQSLLGANGPLGFLSTGMASLFGGKAADATGAVALTGSAATLTTAGGVLATAGSSLIAAAAAMGGSSAAGALGALSGPITTFGSSSFGADGAGVGFGVGPGLAGGTDFAPGGMTLVGERGPEVVNLPRGAQVIPNDVLTAARNAKAGGDTYNTFHVNVLPGASRASAEQAAAATAREVQRARRVT